MFTQRNSSSDEATNTYSSIINTLKLRQNGSYFAVTINLRVWKFLNFVRISPFVQGGSIHNRAAFDQIKWRLCAELAHIYTSRPRLVINTSRPKQNGYYFADDIFEFLMKTFDIQMKFHWNISYGLVHNMPALIRQIGAKPLSEAMMAFLLTHICVTRIQWETTLLDPYFIRRCGISYTTKTDMIDIILFNSAR